MFCACVRGKKCVVMTFAMMTLYLVVLGLPLMVAGHWLFRVRYVERGLIQHYIFSPIHA